MSELWLARHGETEWSLSGAHTGRTDIPLTNHGCEQAAALGRRLAGRRFTLVLVSPLKRALETCRIAGFGDQAEIDPNLREWDYGDYEGRSTREIRSQRPDWDLWIDGPLNGEPIDHVAQRAQAVLARAIAGGGDVLLFGHGHILRILSACWLGLAPEGGQLLALGTASLSSLGHEHETRVITSWNLATSA